MRSIVALFAIMAVTSLSAAQDFGVTSSFTLQQIAVLPPGSDGSLIFGDTDHDGRNEIIVSRNGVHILEHQGSNTYTQEHTCLLSTAWAAGDFDGDGNSELLGTLGGHMALFEAIDANSHPTELRWYFKPRGVEDNSEISIITEDGSAIQDSDRDGRPEIVTKWSGRLRILEYFSDDQWIEVFVGEQLGGVSPKVTADFDGDGLLEIALAVNDRIILYESPADNVWEKTFTSHRTNMWNAFALKGGIDTDGNGKPELHFSGMRGVDGLSQWTTTIFEAIDDNTLAEVAVLAHYDGWGGVGFNALGNLDGIGRDELVMEGHCCLYVYQGVAPGSWQLALEYPRTANGPYMYDVNGNGKDELFWGGAIYEATSSLAVVAGRRAQRAVPLQIAPNPLRNKATLLIPEWVRHEPSLAPTTLYVYDIAGRLVQRSRPGRETRGQFEWVAPPQLPSGVYWLQLESSDGWSAGARAVLLPAAR